MLKHSVIAWLGAGRKRLVKALAPKTGIFSNWNLTPNYPLITKLRKLVIPRHLMSNS